MKNLNPVIFSIIADNLCIKERKIKKESLICDDLGADSLDIVEILMDIEEAFDLSIDDEEAEKWKTVQDVINYVKKGQGE